MNLVIASLIYRGVLERPSYTAIQERRAGGEYRRLSYEELWARSLGVAEALRGSGISPGERVAIFADNSIEWVLAYLGIHLMGGVIVPIDAQYTAREIGTLLSFSDSRAVVVDDERAPQVECAIEKGGHELVVFKADSDDAESITSRSPGVEVVPYEHARDDELMSILFTSGTTGEPKGVELTVGGVSSNVRGLLDAIKTGRDDNVLNILPLHHAYSATAGLLTPLAAGATVTLSNSLRGVDILAAMKETGVTIFPGVPRIFTLFDKTVFQKVDSLGFFQRSVFFALFSLSKWVRRATGVRIGRLLFPGVHREFGPRFRFMASGGAKLNKNVCERLLDLGFLVIEGYGLTETSPVVSFTPLSRPTPGSVGLPIDGVEVVVASPDSDGVGEICVRGSGVMRGYHRDERATGEVLRDGWLHTGDLGYVDSDGMIYLTGRAKELIVLPSGKNIYPEEIEKHYSDSPLIKELCVLPVAGTDGAAESLRAVIVPDQERLAERRALDVRDRVKDELEIIGAGLPSYMRIGDLVLMKEELPRTRLGKLRRSVIAEMVEESMRYSGGGWEDYELSPEELAVMETPQARRFLMRLSKLIGRPGPFYPAQELAVDLGIDSLTKMQIAVLLEEEFSLRITEEELLGVRTLGDLLDVLSRVEGGEGRREEVDLLWSRRLREIPQRPLEEVYNLNRGLLARWGMYVAKGVLGLSMRLLFRVSVHGLENLPKEGPVLICPNHQSYLDPVLVYAALPHRIIDRLMFVGSAEMFRRPPLSWLVRVARVILTGSAESAIESLKLSYQALEGGCCLCIFPEGGRARTSELMEPRPGAGILAVESGVPVVPVHIEGAHGTLSPMEPGFRLPKLRVYIGKPILCPGNHGDSSDRYMLIMRRWKEEIQGLKNRVGTM